MEKKAPARFELTISCLLDRRFNQLSHGATWMFGQNTMIFKTCKHSISNLYSKLSKKSPAKFELTISCLLDRRFNQLGHGAEFFKDFIVLCPKIFLRQDTADWIIRHDKVDKRQWATRTAGKKLNFSWRAARKTQYCFYQYFLFYFFISMYLLFEKL